MAPDEEVEADAEKTRWRRRSAEARNGGQRSKARGAGFLVLFFSFLCASVASIGRLELCLCVGTPEHLRLLLRVSEYGWAQNPKPEVRTRKTRARTRKTRARKTRTLIRVPPTVPEISTGISGFGPRYPKYPIYPKNTPAH